MKWSNRILLCIEVSLGGSQEAGQYLSEEGDATPHGRIVWPGHGCDKFYKRLWKPDSAGEDAGESNCTAVRTQEIGSIRRLE
jgi:hypothetical protein